MAQLLRIQPGQVSLDTRVPVPQGPTMGQAIGKGLESLSDVFGRIQEAADTAEAHNVQQRANVLLKGALEKAKQTYTDPDEFAANAPREIEEVQKSVFDSIKSPRVKSALSDRFETLRLGINDDIGLHTGNLRIGKAKGQWIETRFSLAQQRAMAADPKEQARLDGVFEAGLSDMVRVGALGPDDAAKERVTYRNATDDEQGSWLIRNSPQTILDRINDPNFLPTKSQTERTRLETSARESINAKRIDGERARQEQESQFGVNVLGRLMKAEKFDDLLRIRQDLIDRINRQTRNPSPNDLRVNVLEHWQNKIDTQIKALQKGEEDPFKTTNWEAYASISRGILQTPENWSESDILQYVGRGISAKDGEHLVALLQKNEKGSPQQKAAAADLEKAREHLNNYRRSWFFLPEDKRQGASKGTDFDAITTNDREADRIWDMVRARARSAENPGGEDPRKVLQEVMQPFFEKTVSNFFDKWTPFGRTEKEIIDERNKRIEARQLLIQQGKAVTEDSIQVAMNELKTKKSSEGILRNYIDSLKAEFSGKFKKPLPVSAEGQSETHNRMGFDHRGATDVAVHPNSAEGKWLRDYLTAQKIPFIAFDRAVPGQSSGPHIHIGPPSPRIPPRG